MIKIPINTSSSHAFTLVEMLGVLTIIAILSLAAIPAIGDMTASMRRTRALADISGLLENARQYAVSKNTYVWVTFNTPSPDKPLYAVAIASRNGLAQGYGPEDNWLSSTIDTTGINPIFEILNRVLSIENYQIESPDAFPENLPTFKIKTPADGILSMNRSIQFTPSGEAKISAGLQANLQYEASPVTGRYANQKDQLVFNGPTGFLRVHPFGTN